MRIRNAPWKLLAGAFLVLCSCASQRPASPTTEGFEVGTPQVIRLERFRQALWEARVTVNGKSGDFLFDTGGGITLLGKDFTPDLDCRFWGRTTGYNMFGERHDDPHCDGVQIRAGDVALTPVSVGRIDFGDRFPGSKAPDGLLSLDAFDGKAITLDQAAAALIVETPGSLAARTKTMQELPLRVSRECSARCLSAFMGVPTADGMTWLILDSGAGGVSLIAKDYARAFGLDPDSKEQRLRYEVAPGVSVEQSRVGERDDHGRQPRTALPEPIRHHPGPRAGPDVDRQGEIGAGAERIGPGDPRYRAVVEKRFNKRFTRQPGLRAARGLDRPGGRGGRGSGPGGSASRGDAAAGTASRDSSPIRRSG